MERLALACALLLAGFATGCDRQSLADAAKKTEVAVNEGSDKLKPKLEKAGANLKPQLEAAGDQLQAAAQKTGDQISAAAASAETSDAGITATIKAKYIADPNLSALKIEVDTRGGEVTLNGLAKDAAARQRAEEIATSVKGVSGVSNHLVLKQ